MSVYLVLLRTLMRRECERWLFHQYDHYILLQLSFSPNVALGSQE